MNTTEATFRSDRHKSPKKYVVRELEFDELKSLHGRVKVLDRAGRIAEVKITSVKSWKRRPLDLDIHCKYGLYDYFTVSVRNGEPDMTFVEVL